MDNSDVSPKAPKTSMMFRPILSSNAIDDNGLESNRKLVLPPIKTRKSEAIKVEEKPEMQIHMKTESEERLVPSKKKDNKFKQLEKENETETKSDTKGVKKENFIRNLLDNNFTVGLMSIATIYVLFANDIKFMFMPISADWHINLFYVVCLCLFVIEIILLMIAKGNYIFSFFFWMDVISTLSIIFDIDWIFYPILESFVNLSSNDANSSEVNDDNSQSILKNSVSSSKVIRVVRIIRLVRLLRIVKLYKSALQAKQNLDLMKKNKENKRQSSSKIRRNVNISTLTGEFSREATTDIDRNKNFLKESRISKKLTTSILQKCIIIILTLSIIYPILSEEVYLKDDASQFMILSEYICLSSQSGPISSYEKAIAYFQVESKTPIVNITFNDNLFYLNASYVETDFRTNEIGYTFSSDKNCLVTFSNKTISFYEALLGIINTLVTSSILVVISLLLEHDAKKYVLLPLEVMIDIVMKVSKDPINAKNTVELQNGLKAMMYKIENQDLNTKEVAEEKYEVVILKKSIVNISALLAIGFGEAGCEIIKQNLNNDNELNPMVEGQKVMSVFGFCDIRRFDEIVSRMKENTILLVNEIAGIVHKSVDKFSGVCNRNLGDCFLCVWKIPRRDKNTRDFSEAVFTRKANQAVLSYLDVIASFLASKKVTQILKTPMGDSFKLSMGFGLHVGWGIEGAIGSSYKIDASYLSPNVNLAARLEAATKQYGVLILISGEMFDFLTAQLQSIFRLIDVVTVKGSAQPMRLYTTDVNMDFNYNEEENEWNRNKLQIEKDNVTKEFETIGELAVGMFMIEPRFKELMKVKKTKKFYSEFERGVKSYIAGDWLTARRSLRLCIEFDNDGPSKTLHSYIEARNFIAPINWQGCRELMSK